MILLLIFGFMFGPPASAKEEWLCTEEASQIQDGAVLACGIGEGSDENGARVKAFENARAEFIRVCDLSDNCKGYQVNVEPKRTSCEGLSKGYKCYRLLAFTIDSTKMQTPEQNRSHSQQHAQSKSEPNKSSKIEHIVLQETNEVFPPFIYDSIKSNPKVRRGMTKKALLADFGAPEKVEPSWLGKKGVLEMQYQGRMCDDDSLCYVEVGGNTVIGYRSFRPVFTEDLK
jgi:hypothetical protein